MNLAPDGSSLHIQISAALQAAFTALAALDALYFHLWKLRLHAWAETRGEHALHTANACLFPLTVLFLYAGNYGGVALWLAVVATLVTFGLELVDVAHETRARARFGGVSAPEGVLHFGMGVLRAAAFAFALAAKPLEAFDLRSPVLLAAEYPAWVVGMGRLMFGLAVPMAVLHVVLGVVGSRRNAVARGAA